MKFDKKVSGGRMIYTWTAENVPQLIAEDFMPPMYACAQRILISTVERWEDVSRWYANLCEPHLKVDDAIKKKVASLISGKKNDKEKIDALFRFVLDTADTNGENDRRRIFSSGMLVILIGSAALIGAVQLLHIFDVFEGYVWLVAAY
ncbi:MAG: hypothetical protein J6Q80_01060, partial [Lentisphaeria bacterium]|nr:hypothetical protein [Lentisphaeria bacterium]